MVLSELRLREERREQALTFSKTRFGKHNSLSLPNGIRNVPFLMKPIHGVPIKRLPGPRAIMQGEIKQREHCLINLFVVRFHGF